MYIPPFISSSVDGHLGCFHILFMANNALWVYKITLWVSVFYSFGYIPEVELLARMVIPRLMFWGMAALFSAAAALFIFTFSSMVFDNSHPNQYEVVPYCSFYLHFPIDKWCWLSSHVLIGPLNTFFEEKATQAHYWIGLFGFLVVVCIFGF